VVHFWKGAIDGSGIHLSRQRSDSPPRREGKAVLSISVKDAVMSLVSDNVKGL